MENREWFLSLKVKLWKKCVIRIIHHIVCHIEKQHDNYNNSFNNNEPYPKFQ